MTQKEAQPRPCVYRYLYLGEILYIGWGFFIPRKQLFLSEQFNSNTAAYIRADGS